VASENKKVVTKNETAMIGPAVRLFLLDSQFEPVRVLKKVLTWTFFEVIELVVFLVHVLLGMLAILHENYFSSSATHFLKL